MNMEDREFVLIYMILSPPKHMLVELNRSGGRGTGLGWLSKEILEDDVEHPPRIESCHEA
jgi:hypothetical protein